MPETLPSTYGGPGWIPRSESHRAELGTLWAAAGQRSEVAPLKQVVLHFPGEELRYDDPPDRWLMLRPVDLPKMRQQALALAAAYAAEGVKVHFYRPTRRPPPNVVFFRDLFFMTPEGAILGRPAAQQRAGEERFMAESLAALGIPILRTLRGTATFEGADALWIAPGEVLFGVDGRSNRSGRTAVSAALQELGVKVTAVEMPPRVQHLLGVVNFADRHLAVVDADRVPNRIRQVLKSRGYTVLDVGGPEVADGRALNFVTVGPGRIVMPAGCPEMRVRYEAAGISTVEVDMSEYIAAGGAMGCCTGILERAR